LITRFLSQSIVPDQLLRGLPDSEAKHLSGMNRDLPFMRRSAGLNFFIDRPRELGSWHDGSCNFVFEAGGTRSVNNAINGKVLGYLCNVRDGEVVDVA
jgi:hypothetical protein